jgi:ABC-type branched-subunit amino acid transport system substrate-binding protein
MRNSGIEIMVSCELIKWRASRPACAPCKWVAVLCAVLALTVCVAKAEDGVLSDRIVFGQPAALDGPASALGRGMRDGILAAFSEANRAGGIGGRKLELLSADDGYDPVKSIEATRRLLDESRVFASRLLLLLTPLHPAEFQQHSKVAPVSP